MHICVERKMGLIHKKAIYRSVFSVCYCKHLITRGDWASFLWTSILFLYLNAQSLVHTERHLWRRAQLQISVAAWRWFCSSLPLSLFPFTPPLHWLNQGLGLLVSLCNFALCPCISGRNLSPPVTELEGVRWTGNDFGMGMVAQVKEWSTRKTFA